MKSDWEFKYITSVARRMKQDKNLTPAQKDALTEIIAAARRGMALNAKELKELKEWALRNPAFEDDEVGYPDDDFKK